MNINHTRSMVRAALNGELDGVATRRDPIFGVEVPTEVPGRPERGPRAARDVGGRRRVRRPGGEARPRCSPTTSRSYADGVPPSVREAGPLATDDGGPGLELAGPGEG